MKNLNLNSFNTIERRILENLIELRDVELCSLRSIRGVGIGPRAPTNRILIKSQPMNSESEFRDAYTIFKISVPEEEGQSFYMLATPQSKMLLRALIADSSGRLLATKERFNQLPSPSFDDISSRDVYGRSPFYGGNNVIIARVYHPISYLSGKWELVNLPILGSFPKLLIICGFLLGICGVITNIHGLFQDMSYFILTVLLGFSVCIAGIIGYLSAFRQGNPIRWNSIGLSLAMCALGGSIVVWAEWLLGWMQGSKPVIHLLMVTGNFAFDILVCLFLMKVRALGRIGPEALEQTATL